MKDDKGKIVELELNDVLPNRFQPRIKFNEKSIMELSESIKKHGVIQPIIVRPIGDKYEIIAGERRYKASVLAGLNTIPSRIIDLNDRDSLEVALTENVQRKDLTPIEEAISYKRALDMGGMTQEQLASMLGSSQSTIANKIRLLNLCDEVQEALMEEKISERHARSLLKLENTADQRDMLKRIIRERLTVRKVDTEIKELLEKKVNDNTTEEINLISDDKALENKTADILESTHDSLNDDDDDVIDISKLFDEVEMGLNDNHNDNPKKDREEKRLDEIQSIEKEENDNMINNINNVNDNSQNNFSRFFGSSLTPEDDNLSSKSSFEFNNINNNSINDDNLGNSSMLQSSQLNSQNSIFSSNDPIASNDSQMASNEPVNSQSSMFSNLMNKEQQDDYIDNETFNNFLDPSYVDGTKQVDMPINKNVIDSSVFAKFLDPEYDSVSPTEDNGSSNNQSQISNMNFEPSNSTVSTTPLESNIYNSNMDSPITQTMKPIDLLAPESANHEIYNDNSKNELENYQTFNGMAPSVNKPDLLAPMGSSVSNSSTSNISNIFSQNIFNQPVDNDKPHFINQPVQQDLESVKPEFNSDINKEQEVLSEENNNSELNIGQTGFVRASHSSDFDEIPTTPIIENFDMNKLLSSDNMKSNVDLLEPKKELNILQPSEETIPTTIAETANINSLNSEINRIENQPIIITDYNKQYDPILPDNLVDKNPEIDIRQIINMIRELNDKIESYGFEIDTEEFDLEDIYQVIFKITKK